MENAGLRQRSRAAEGWVLCALLGDHSNNPESYRELELMVTRTTLCGAAFGGADDPAEIRRMAWLQQ